MKGWLDRWERHGWRNAKGNRIRHRDIWERIQRLLKQFEGSDSKRVEILHVRGHDGVAGNERADKLAKEGAKLRFDLMEKAAREPDWFQRALHIYWGNRKTS